MFSSLNCDKLEEEREREGKLESSHMNAQKTNTRGIARRKVISPQTATCLSGHLRPGKSAGERGTANVTREKESQGKERCKTCLQV